MSGPRVYDGVKTIPVVETPLAGPIPPFPDGDGSIFISVPSYRDGERCALTLKSIFENAADPDKVIVALIEQNHAEDKFCLEMYCKSFGIKAYERKNIRTDMTKLVVNPDQKAQCPRIDQIRMVAFHFVSSKGPMLARSMARKALGNEEFCMQVDAHSDFARDWDVFLKEEWKRTHNEFAVLSTVPPPKADKQDFMTSRRNEVPRLCRIKSRDNGFPDFLSPADGTAFALTQPLLGSGWSAAFSFAKCHLEETVPYDPFAQFAMPIEQFSRYARMWTRGYDTYTPSKSVVFHDYETQANGHGDNEWFKRNRRDRFRLQAVSRMKNMVGIPVTEDEYSQERLANMGLYGLGKRRSIQQLEAFANIDLKKSIGNVVPNLKCTGHELVPYDANISPLENLYNNPNDLEPQPEFPMRTNPTFYHPQAVVDTFMLPGDEADEAAIVAIAAGGGAEAQAKLLDSFSAEHLAPRAAMAQAAKSVPPMGILFILWILGLIVWFILFRSGGGSGSSSDGKPRKKKSSQFKEV